MNAPDYLLVKIAFLQFRVGFNPAITQKGPVRTVKTYAAPVTPGKKNGFILMRSLLDDLAVWIADKTVTPELQLIFSSHPVDRRNENPVGNGVALLYGYPCLPL
jgi:hypothetical protein